MIKLSKVCKIYNNHGRVVALDEINLEFASTGLVAIMGKSGSGKTTLLNIISGLDKATSGDVIIDGHNLKNFTEKDINRYRNKNLGFVFQNQQLIPHLNVLENVEINLTIAGVNKKERRRRALEALKIAGLGEEWHKKLPADISGGEFQRVQIARAIVNNPSIILADEPMSALDSETRVQIMTLFKELSSQCLVIMVTHNYDSVKDYVDRFIYFDKGKIAKDEKTTNKRARSTARNIVSELPFGGHGRRTMTFGSATRLAFRNLTIKRVSALIMSLSASIGIAALTIVLAVSLGLGTRVADARNFNIVASPIVISTADTSYNPDHDDDKAYLGNNNYTSNINIITEHFISQCINKLNEDNYNFIYTTSTLDFHFISSFGGIALNNQDFRQLPDKEIVERYYDLLDKESGGYIAQAEDEIMLVVDENNNISINLMTMLNIGSTSGVIELTDLVNALNTNRIIKWIPNDSYWETYWLDPGYYTSKDYYAIEYSSAGRSLKVTGVLRKKADAAFDLLQPGFAYTKEVYRAIQETEIVSDIVEAQITKFSSGSSASVIYGQSFVSNSLKDKIAYLKNLGYLGENDMYPELYTGKVSGISRIEIYVKNISDKNYIINKLDAYNAGITNAEYKIIYTDTANASDLAIGDIEQTILNVLTIFAITALAISAILIMSIMFSSIKERTREIGILRTMGARRLDILRIFMIEVGFIGLLAGVFGLALGNAINIIINASFTGVILGASAIAEMTIVNGALAVVLSFGLALLAGLIPSLRASLKTPIAAMKK